MQLTEQNILCLANHDWDYLWQRHQELMWRLAQDGNRVLYVDTLGIRSPGIREWHRIFERAKKWGAQLVKGIRQPAPNVYGFSPVLLPFLNSPWALRINSFWLRSSIHRTLNHLGFKEPIIWVYLPTPTVANIVNGLQRKLLVYDCVDNQPYSPRGTVAGLQSSEQWLATQADLVFTTSSSLYDQIRSRNSNVYLVPAGVNLDRFSRSFDGSNLPPADLAHIPRPRICYFGQIDDRLDQDLIAEVARCALTGALVLLGAIRTDISHLLQMDNVYWLKSKPHSELSSYLDAMDVLILPYRINDYTQAIYPAKLHECLAVGKPVVTTDLPEIRPFHEVVYIGREKEDFLQCIAKALAEDDPVLLSKRRKVAEANSWQSRYEEIAQKLAECLAAKSQG
jgi:glycosyltransferase involved in cell wall biosynthesis